MHETQTLGRNVAADDHIPPGEPATDTNESNQIRYKSVMITMRDIDYAAKAVSKSILEKFGRQNDLTELKVEALDRTIRISLEDHQLEDTRDNLMMTIRKAADLSALWSES
jgi:hypothetical protein